MRKAFTVLIIVIMLLLFAACDKTTETPQSQSEIPSSTKPIEPTPIIEAESSPSAESKIDNNGDNRMSTPDTPSIATEKAEPDANDTPIATTAPLPESTPDPAYVPPSHAPAPAPTESRAFPSPSSETTPMPSPVPIPIQPSAEPEAMPTPSSPTPTPTTEPSVTLIYITTGNSDFSIKLYDNDAAKALAALLPLTIDMSELNGNEKYYYLTDKLPTDSERVGNINAGDLMLYGSDCLVLFYESFATSYSYTRLGTIEDASGLATALGRGSVEIILSK